MSKENKEQTYRCKATLVEESAATFDVKASSWDEAYERAFELLHGGEGDIPWKPQDDDIHFDICESHLEEEKAKGEEV